MELTLSGLKALTTTEYDRARERALERVKSRNGVEPTRAQFKREQGALLNILDYMAMGIFLFAFLVSSFHIAQHMWRLMAAKSIEGIGVGLHQISYIVMAEFSLIMFLVMFAISPRRDWRRWVFFLLAIAALVFIFNANIASQIGILESVLPPLFTVGIGFRLEYLIAKSIERARLVDEKYQAALDGWEIAQQDAESHPDFARFLRIELWAELARKNKAYIDAPNGFKVAAVSREMERETWAHGSTQFVTTFSANGHRSDERPLAQPPAPPILVELVEAN